MHVHAHIRTYAQKYKTRHGPHYPEGPNQMKNNK